ncbi:MAG: hypothetical protein QMD61_00435 [Methanobacterium sp.]|nr:hypothetical protein [Methanobacterium sp.]
MCAYAYLICKCNVSYKIENKEDMVEFSTCQWGNPLKYQNTIEEYMNDGENSQSRDYESEKHFNPSNNDLLLIMNTLKEDHERKDENHLQRELNYHLRHLREIYIEKVEISTESYESPVAKEFGDNDLKKMKEILLNEMGLLKEDKEKG